MNTIDIKYIFRLQEGEKRFEFSFSADTFELQGKGGAEKESWTSLAFNQCPHCPLKAGETAECPLALTLSGIIRSFRNVNSFEEVQVRVITPQRSLSAKTTAQKGVSSLIGLLTPASGCPHTIFFRPMARFHLPFATEEETIYRATSMYILAQLFRIREGKKPDYALEGLKKIYKDMHTLNSAFADRLRAGAEKDSTVNALIILDLFTKSIPDVINEKLEEIQYLFAPYLQDS